MSKLAVKPPRAADLYEVDFHLWTIEQARLLRERRFTELDLPNLIDEVESVGESQKQEIEIRLDSLIAHLVKWRFQPGQRSSGWEGTIREQRRRLARLLRGSPSLRRYPAEVFEDCYLSGRLLASKETGIDVALFPDAPPFTVEQALSDDFLPKEVGLLDQS